MGSPESVSFLGKRSCNGALRAFKLALKRAQRSLLRRGGDEESPVFASQIPSAQRPNTSYSVPVSHHSLIKQSTRLFYLTARAFRSSTPKVFTINSLLRYAFFEVLFGGDEESRTPDPLLARQVLSQLSYTPTVF